MECKEAGGAKAKIFCLPLEGNQLGGGGDKLEGGIIAHKDAWQHAAREAVSLCLDGNMYAHLHNTIGAQVTDGKEALTLPRLEA